MTRIPYANIEEAPQKVRDFFAKMRANTNNAEIMNIFKMVAHSDISVREIGGFEGAVTGVADFQGRVTGPSAAEGTFRLVVPGIEPAQGTWRLSRR